MYWQSLVQVPNADRVVLYFGGVETLAALGSRQPSDIGAETQRPLRACSAPELSGQLACGYVPEFYHAIVGRCRHDPAIWAESGGPYAVLVFKPPDFFATHGLLWPKRIER